MLVTMFGGSIADIRNIHRVVKRSETHPFCPLAMFVQYCLATEKLFSLFLFPFAYVLF